MLYPLLQGDPTLDSFLRSQDPAFLAQQQTLRSPAGSTYSTIPGGGKPPSPRVRKMSPSNRSQTGSVAGSYAGSMPGASAYGTAYGSAKGSMATGYDLGGAGYEISEDEQKLLAAIQVLEAAMQARVSPACQPLRTLSSLDVL